MWSVTRFERPAATAPLGHALAEGVYGTYHALQRTVAAVLSELDLSESLADAVWQLDPAEGPQPRRALAERLHCDPSNVTLLVDKLELRGLVRRSEHPTDRRVKAISLTHAGVAARDRLLSATARAPAFASLSHDEQRQLADLLGRCVASQKSEQGTERHRPPAA